MPYIAVMLICSDMRHAFELHLQEDSVLTVIKFTAILD